MSAVTNRDRFLNVMEYRPVDRVPNWEVGVWGQTIDRWRAEGLNADDFTWDWFTGEECFGFDPREYIPVSFGMIPTFEPEVLEENDRYVVARNGGGIVTKALKEGTAHGTRASMDQYLRFPVETREDFAAMKSRYVARMGTRYPTAWREIMLPRWKERRHVLVLATSLQPGDSGGALVDASGTVVGVAFATDPGQAHTGYALTSDQVRTVLANAGSTRVATGSCLVE